MSSPADHPAPGRDPSATARVEQFYASHVALVRSVCRSLLRDRSEAEDAVQQTFLSAQRALLNGSSPREPAAWLATIARHESLARVRARMREPLPVEIDEHETAVADAHTAAVRRQETGELRDALAQLPNQQREAILLRELRGLSYEEVAFSLAVTTSAVESLLFRARRNLKLRLQEVLAAVTPVTWIRDLAARLAGGGLAGPAAAKVAAVGVGSAVMAGGAVVPTVIGLGHAPHSTGNVSLPAIHRAMHSATPHRPITFAPVSASLPKHEPAAARVRDGKRVAAADSVRRAEVSDTHASREREISSGDRSSGSEARDGGTTQRSSDTSDDSQSGMSDSPSSDSHDDSSGDSSSDTTTTATTTTATTTTTTTGSVSPTD